MMGKERVNDPEGDLRKDSKKRHYRREKVFTSTKKKRHPGPVPNCTLLVH